MEEGHLQRVLGENVRAYRRKHGLSQEKLGEKLRKNRTYVGAIERAEENMTLRSLERLAASLGVPPLDLLNSPGPPAPPTDREDEGPDEAAGTSDDS
jgi:transcriptional regulator with XRE-family HTH domain